MTRSRLVRALRRPRLVLVALVALASTGCGAVGLTSPETGCNPRDPRDEREWGLHGAGEAPGSGMLPYCQPTSR